MPKGQTHREVGKQSHGSADLMQIARLSKVINYFVVFLVHSGT